MPPFYPYEIRNHDQIWGRGSVDAKACVAAQIIALQELLAVQTISPDDVALLFVVGEETGGDGMRRANDLNLAWDAVIFGEPTELNLASGHKGLLGLTLTARGKAGHSGYPWLGENANSMLLPVLVALDRIRLPHSEKYGNSTLNIGRMEGGVSSNVIAETATAQIQVRIAAGSAEHAKDAILDTVHRIDNRIDVHFVHGGYGPVDIDSDVPGEPSPPLPNRTLPPPSFPLQSLTRMHTPRLPRHHRQLRHRYPQPTRRP